MVNGEFVDGNNNRTSKGSGLYSTNLKDIIVEHNKESYLQKEIVNKYKMINSLIDHKS